MLKQKRPASAGHRLVSAKGQLGGLTVPTPLSGGLVGTPVHRLQLRSDLEVLVGAIPGPTTLTLLFDSHETLS